MPLRTYRLAVSTLTRDGWSSASSPTHHRQQLQAFAAGVGLDVGDVQFHVAADHLQHQAPLAWLLADGIDQQQVFRQVHGARPQLKTTETEGDD